MLLKLLTRRGLTLSRILRNTAEIKSDAEIITKDRQQLEQLSVQDLRKTLHEQISSRTQLATFNSSTNNSDLSQPLSIFRLIQQKCNPKESTIQEYHDILSLLSHCKRPASEIVAIFEMLKMRVDDGADIKITDKFLALALDSVCYHDVKFGLEMMEQAKKAGLEVGRASYSTVLRNFLSKATEQALRVSKGNRIEHFMTSELYKDACKIIAEYPFNNKDSFKLFLPFLKAQVKILNLDGCKYWLEKAKRFDLDYYTPLYNLYVNLLCRVDEVKSAVKVIEEMKQSNDKERLFPNSYTYGCLLHAIGPGFHLHPMDIIQEMKRWKISPETKTWNIILWKAAIVGKTVLVERYYQKMMEDKIPADRDTFVARMVALASSVNIRASNDQIIQIVNGRRKKRSPAMIKLIHEAYSKSNAIIEQLQDTIPNAKFLNTYLYFSYEARKVSEGLGYALKWISKLEEGEPFLAALQKDGADLTEQHLGLSSESFTDYSKVANPKAVVDSITFNILIALKFQQFVEDDAWKLFSIMPKLHVLPDETTYYLLLKQACQKKDEERLKLLINLLKERRTTEGKYCRLFVDGSLLDSYLKNLRLNSWIPESIREDISWLRTGRKMY